MNVVEININTLTAVKSPLIKRFTSYKHVSYNLSINDQYLPPRLSVYWVDQDTENFNLNSVKIYFSIIQEESLEINYDIYLLHYSYSIMPTDFFDCILSF
jgi:hypothetical protein